MIQNCELMSIPFKCLGLTMGGNPRKKKFWLPIVNKIKNKLTKWKGKALSFAGRVCLLKFVLTTYHFTICHSLRP